MKKNMTLRLEGQQVTDLDLVSTIDGEPVAEIVRTALDRYIETRKKDPDFREKLRQHIERMRTVLDDDLQAPSVPDLSEKTPTLED